MDDIVGTVKQQLAVIPPELVKPICVGAVAIIVVLFLMLFTLCVVYINMRPKPPVIKKAEKKDQNAAAAPKTPQEKPIKMRYEDLPIISGRFGELLALNGLIKVGPITKIFFQVIDIVKNTTYDIRWRYKLPCFMLIGPDGSGKTTLLNSLKFEQLSSGDSTPLWKLFKKGAIFEMPKPDVTEKEGLFWSFIAELFMFIRPRRPLDGLIITVPADMLMSQSVDVESYAKDQFTKVFGFQHDINFKLPIYIMVTKSDLIPGFADFARVIDPQSKQQIFGWSNPNSINVAFSSECIQDIFQTLIDGVRKAILLFSRHKEESESLKKAVLFQHYINLIRNTLSLYLNAMFQAHDPKDGLLLRGVYFTGRPKDLEVSDEILEPSALSPKQYSHIDLKLESSYNDELYFLQDLFKEKIFREHNIAYPIRDDGLDMAKTVFRGKLIFAGASLFISAGWFYGNFHLREKIHQYLHGFNNMRGMLIKLKGMEQDVSTTEEQMILNQQAKKLLQNIPIPSRWELMSFFVPQSWFSHIHKQISDTVSLVFDSVIVRAMFIDLHMNTKTVIGEMDENGDGLGNGNSDRVLREQYAHHDVFDIGSFVTFQKLKEFTDKIKTLKKLSKEYNSILHNEDRESMLDLSRELFHDQFDIVEVMRSRSPNKQILPPQFDLQIFEEAIENRLLELFGAFIREVFNGNIDRIFQNICEDIDRLFFVSQQANMSYNNADLARVYQKTLLLSDIMQNKNFAWRADEHFMPSKDWADMVDTLNASEIVDMSCINGLLRSAEVEFQKFKDRIRAHKTKMTGTVVSDDLLSLSQGFDTFQKELKTILDFPFICTPPHAALTTLIMDDKMLMWDPRRLKEVSDLVDKYYDFAGTIPEDIRVQYYENYKSLCRKCFYPTAQAMLGNAQMFDDLPVGTARNLLQDAYKRQADNLRKSSIFLGKVAKFFKEICDEDSAKDCGFAKMVVTHYLGLLEKIDALFNLETPYSTGNEIFDTWTGERNPKFLNIGDGPALKRYLVSQFNRLKFLAKDLASPVVELLSIPVFEADIRDHTLLDKWREIVTSVEDYEAQKPGNSVAALESFLSETLKKVDINSFDPEGEIRSISEEDGDFFENKRASVAKALMSRADIIQYDRAAAAYNAIQSFFNQNLAHKFPFGSSQDEATVTDIERFIKIYDQQQSVNIEGVLKGNAERKNVNPDVFEFLQNLKKVVEFLRTWISHVKTSDAQSSVMSFLMTMRPSPDAEAFTSSVLERQVRVKNVSINDNSMAVFFNNDPIEVQFVWVEGADERPYDKNLSKNLRIEGVNAIFSFGGRWAMFRMIEEHKMNKSMEYPNGVLLEFDVPVSTQDNTSVTSKMVLKVVPELKDGDKTTPLAWPVFPSRAPGLHDAAASNRENESNAVENEATARAARENAANGAARMAAADRAASATSSTPTTASTLATSTEDMERELEAAAQEPEGEEGEDGSEGGEGNGDEGES